MYDNIRWDEGFKDDVMDDLLENTQKFDDLLISLASNVEDIDEGVNSLNKLLTDIYEKYTKCEVKFKDHCENCGCTSGIKRSKFRNDKPWFTDDCKDLYKKYKKSLADFNRCHSNENHIKLNLDKQKYKSMENKLKRQYKNQEGNMLDNMRKKNPRKFYRKFKKKKIV